MEVPGPPSVLELYNRNGGKSSSTVTHVAITCLCCTDLNMSHFFTGEEIVYGTTDGKVGLVQIGEQSATAKWEIDNVKKKGGMRFIPGFYLVAHKSKYVL